jgi:hypothetical protein
MSIFLVGFHGGTPIAGWFMMVYFMENLIKTVYFMENTIKI